MRNFRVGLRRPRSRAAAVAAMCIGVMLQPLAVGAGEYYISTTGSNGGSGGIASPWSTFDYAIGQINPGDTLYVRGGTYDLNSRIRIQKGGTSGAPISMLAYPGETPILDFDSNPSSSDRGIQLERDWWRIKGLTVQNAPDNGIWVSGSNNVFEQLVVRWNGDSGFQLSGDSSREPSNNLILNTDSYENYDANNHGENADGFAAKFRELGPGNVFRGNRAWGNSDDGWDFWAAANGVTVENSWSFKNGINIWGDPSYAGDGNGIKLGQDSGTHTVNNNLVWGNPHNGIDVNGNANSAVSPPYVPHGVTVNNNTAFANGGRNFRFDENYPHVLRNNISLSGSVTIYGPVDDAYNTWNGISVDAGDFLSLDDSGATGPRQADGSLPQLDFLRLAADSHLIDAGVDVGLPYNGTAPDLGAYESTPEVVYLPGDFDENTSVDGADLARWVAGFGMTAGAVHGDGDANSDGAVFGDDFLAWQRDVGAAAAVAAVPEPLAVNLAIVALGALLAGTRVRMR